ncbi:unnamed protein product [Enterobius vermicularis]|uniref:Lipase_GDSL domain-containing protein n=1 Tax=Enterobius vermicularis TaxID=51028 RepID=A0A3P6I001_ENTVE|nr:unnamed protein product [Enterobius vermicularis]
MLFETTNGKTIFAVKLAGASNFNCVLPKEVDDIPLTAHSLSPKHIKVIAALGDSYTYFNPSLKGASLNNQSNSEHLNVAISGGTSSTLQGQVKNFIVNVFEPSFSYFRIFQLQAIELITRMTNMSSIDVKNDWKFITLFIGTNNIRAFCTAGVIFRFYDLLSIDRDEKCLCLLNSKHNLLLMSPDCFHFSEIGNDALAKLLWNNLMTPVESSTNVQNFDPVQKITVKCPDMVTVSFVNYCTVIKRK